MQSKLGKLVLVLFICIIVLIIGFSIYPLNYFQTNRSEIKSNSKGYQVQYYGIAADSDDNFYLSFDSSVFVYDKRGNYLYRLLTPGLCEIQIENDTLLLWPIRSDMKYVYTLDGKLLSKTEYTNEDRPKSHSFLEERKCYREGKLLYRFHSVVGFWWVENASRTIVAVIPLAVAVMKAAIILALICLVFLIQILYKMGMKT